MFFGISAAAVYSQLSNLAWWFRLKDCTVEQAAEAPQVLRRQRTGGTVGYQVEVVAYDDGAWQMRATEQAERLVIDPQVLAVLGNWLLETTTAAAQVYAKPPRPSSPPVGAHYLPYPPNFA